MTIGQMFGIKCCFRKLNMVCSVLLLVLLLSLLTLYIHCVLFCFFFVAVWKKMYNFWKGDFRYTEYKIKKNLFLGFFFFLSFCVVLHIKFLTKLNIKYSKKAERNQIKRSSMCIIHNVYMKLGKKHRHRNFILLLYVCTTHSLCCCFFSSFALILYRKLMFYCWLLNIKETWNCKILCFFYFTLISFRFGVFPRVYLLIEVLRVFFLLLHIFAFGGFYWENVIETCEALGNVARTFFIFRWGGFFLHKNKFWRCGWLWKRWSCLVSWHFENFVFDWTLILFDFAVAITFHSNNLIYSV